MDNLQVILLGAPGSGKGTQAGRLVSEFNLKHISMGDLLRAEIAKKSELGLIISEIVNAGKLVDDATALELLRVNCDLSSASYIFDGFPRNGDQAAALDEIVLKEAKSVAIYFDADLNKIVERLVNRRTCGKCNSIFNLITRAPRSEGVCDDCGGELTQRKDDNEEVVRNRLDVYESTIGPVLDYYEARKRLVKVDATQAPDEVFSELAKVIKR